MYLKSNLTVVTVRCYDASPSCSHQIGLYFSYISGRFVDKFFSPFYSVMDDFGNLVPVEG